MTSQDLPQPMKAHLLEAFNTDYVVRDVPLPKIEDANDILVRVDAASYCHTDAVLAEGNMLPYPYSFPHVGCHEFAGTIVAIPHDSPQHRLKIGDRVGIPGRGYHVCGTCLECQNPSGVDPDEPGYSVYCPHAKGHGIALPGGFQEYSVVDSRQVEVIPPELTAVEVAPLMCAGLTIYTAIRKCDLKAGDSIGIMGCGGGLGHLGLQFATKMGLQVIGIDTSSQGLEFAEGLNTGATLINPKKETADEVRRRLGKADGKKEFPEMGLDAVIILPESQKGFDYGVNLLKNGGLLMLVSFPKDGFHMNAWDLVFRRIRMEGSLIGSNRAMKEMFAFCVKHGVKARTRSYSFAELNTLVKDYHAGSTGKGVIDMSLKD